MESAHNSKHLGRFFFFGDSPRVLIRFDFIPRSPTKTERNNATTGSLRHLRQLLQALADLLPRKLLQLGVKDFL
jgi:hypothetical protein